MAFQSTAGVAPRISAADTSKFIGKQVTLVAEAQDYDEGNNNCEVRCIVSDLVVKINTVGTPSIQFAQINEIVVTVASDNSLSFVAMGQMHDEFDPKAYKQLVQLIGAHHQNLFY
jgi:hypothetical protein